MRPAFLLSLLAFLAAAPARAQEQVDVLAKQLSNPVAALISVPLQLNYDSGYANDGDKWTLNVQPVVPVDMSRDWNLISRTILPVIQQNKVVNNDSQSGLGDTVQSLFLSPKAPTSSGWIWGAGPVFLLPTATEDELGSGKWGIGPTAVALKQTADGWTYGALANHIWSVAGDDARADVNATFLQPFLSKGIGQGRTLTVNTESTYDWERKQWTIPVNFMYSKVT
ncbi:MAG TPA: transporter, partial [Burkholderiales bacterium]|nr:transporter [Burkholderiales bacterium]